ncbi:unnamed protein product [Anisakis simplex]|uniref:Uncharacterized protein n=1 Tax=Anisakis simplex TaxID=6269 RepID=A0A0M3JJ90_ANISI|nr:unnamed protein product [Anisakis simplex]
MMQPTNSNISSNNGQSDVILAMTSVTSLSYNTTPQSQSMSSNRGESASETANSGAVNREGSSNQQRSEQLSDENQNNLNGDRLRDILNPDTFTIGWRIVIFLRIFLRKDLT